MAASFRMINGPELRSRTPAILFVHDSLSPDPCFQAAERLMPATSLSAGSRIDLTRKLLIQDVDLVVHYSQGLLEQDAYIDEERVARINGAMYLPVIASLNEILIGPLFSCDRSCAHCWFIRQSHRDQLSIPREQSKQLSQAEKWKDTPALGGLIISAIIRLLAVKSEIFTSPYVVFDRLSRSLTFGTLTSCQECSACRTHLRTLVHDNAELTRLIGMQQVCSTSSGEPMNEL